MQLDMSKAVSEYVLGVYKEREAALQQLIGEIADYGKSVN